MDALERAYVALLRAAPREPTLDEIRVHLNGVEVTNLEGRVARIASQRAILQNMLKNPGIEQRTPDWYAARDELLTASDLGQALNRGKFGNRSQLLVKKVTRVAMKEPGPGEFNPFKHGRIYETIALQLYQQHLRSDDTGAPLLPVHEFGLLRHPNLRCFGASPDGVTELGVMLEIKCPFIRKINGEIAEQYYIQMQGQMEVADLDDCDFCEVELDTDVYMDLRDMEADVGTPWDQKGIVVADEADAVFDYSPPGADADGLRAYLTGVGIDPRFIITNKRVRMWRQRKILVQRVTRDRAFWAVTVPFISAFWADVEAGRVAMASPEGWNPDAGKKKRATPVRRKKTELGSSTTFPEDVFGGV